MIEKKESPRRSQSQGKGNNKQSQINIFFEYLQENIATASMVSVETGLTQKNICRFKRRLEKAGRLWEIEKRKCKHTGSKASYLTVDPEKAPNNNQLKMFDYE